MIAAAHGGVTRRLRPVGVMVCRYSNRMASAFPDPADRSYQYKVFVLPCWSCKGDRDLAVPRGAEPGVGHGVVTCYACKGNGIASIVFKLPAAHPPN
jgi:hypothetical protein